MVLKLTAIVFLLISMISAAYAGDRSRGAIDTSGYYKKLLSKPIEFQVTFINRDTSFKDTT